MGFFNKTPEEIAEQERKREQREVIERVARDRTKRIAEQERKQEQCEAEQEQKRAWSPDPERKRYENFLRSPKGMARSAWEAERKVWQFLEVISETTGNVVPMIGTYTADEQGTIDLQKSKGRAQDSPIEQIESEGWTLANAGYVFQEIGSVSRDKFLSSGQQEAVSGRILGIYIFKRTSRPDDWTVDFD